MARPRPSLRGAAAEASRRASAFPLAVLVLLLAARLFDVLTAGRAGQVPFTVALLVIPLLCAVPRTRALVSQHWRQALTVQAVLTWVPFAVFGAAWQAGIGGLLAGLVLLMIPGRVSWLLAGMLLAAEVVVRAAVVGWPVEPAWYAVIYVVVYYTDDALAFFGVVRLAQIVGEVQQARADAAGLAVARERLAAARELQGAIGERLAGIAAVVAAARRALPVDAERARAQVAAAGTAARDAVAQARQVTARHRGTANQEPAAPAAGPAVIGAQLAWAVLVTVLLMYTTFTVGYSFYLRYSAPLTAVITSMTVLVVALQLYHSGAARTGRRPPGWPVTLGLQVLLVYAPFFPFLRVAVTVLAPFLAGSVLLLVPGRWRWAGFAAVVASYSALTSVLSLRGLTLTAAQQVPNALYFAAIIAQVGLLVYGLAWLAGLAAELEGLNGELARVAVVGERLRIARDVHDLLGLGLSAIALKADLAARLIGRDNAQAAAELAEMTRICASTRAEVRLVAGGGQRLSLAAETAAARQILTSAGIQVQEDIPAEPLPKAVDDVLATVLREAVTNILRHSAAVTCTIEAVAGDGTVRLQISNDGAPARPSAGGGNGLANLTARLHDFGGRLASRQAGGWFDLTAEIPLEPAATATAPGLARDPGPAPRPSHPSRADGDG